MNLDTSTWKTFYLHDLFDICMGNGFDKNKMSDDDPSINFVSRVSYGNGVDWFVDRVEGVAPFPAGLITVALGGSYLGSSFVQLEPFYTGQNVAVMKAKEDISLYSKLFVTRLIRYESAYKYQAFGRELNSYIKTVFTINLPQTSNGKPNWHWIDSFIGSLHSKPVTTRNAPKPHPFDTNTWKWFKLGGEDGLFKICKGKRLTSEDQTEGDTPYIGAIDSNNGVSNNIGQTPIHEGNTISLSYNGSVGEAYYQPNPYWATDDVNALYLHKKYGTLTPSIGLFICTILKQEKYRYSYGRKWTLENMVNTIIKLPATTDGNPDWEWMKNYIESLPYGDRL